MNKIRITKTERRLIASTPERECWICDEIVSNIQKDKKGYYLNKKWIKKEGFGDHLAQIIGYKRLKGVI
jgi:hypothetical protein